MKNICILLAVCLLPAVAAAQFFDARNRAMGGTGVASSHYTSAGFLNPSLLAMADKGDSFGFILPSLGITLTDEDGLVERVDDYQDLVNQVGTILDNPASTNGQKAAALIALNQALLDLQNRQATADVGFGLSFASPSDNGFAWAIVAHSFADAQIFARIDPGDTAIISGANNSNDLNNIQSEGIVLGAGVTEVGVALAQSFKLGETMLSVGVTPKAQRIDTYNYSLNVNNFDDNDFDNSQFTDDTTEFNVDVGVGFRPVPAVTVGLVGRNLIEHEINTVQTNNRQFTSTHVAPRLVLGAALQTDGVTVAVDYDLNEIDRFDDGQLAGVGITQGDDTQLLRIGLELDLAGWLQLRGGYQTDLEDTLGDVFTAGLGLAPGEVFHLDLFGLLGDGDTYGAGLQLAFTF